MTTPSYGPGPYPAFRCKVKKTVLTSQFSQDYRKKLATCFDIFSVVFGWAFVEVVRRVSVWWQILTKPSTIYEKARWWQTLWHQWQAEFDGRPPATRRACRRSLRSRTEVFVTFFSSFDFASARLIKTVSLYCCVLISWQNLLLRLANSPGRLQRNILIFCLALGTCCQQEPIFCVIFHFSGSCIRILRPRRTNSAISVRAV